MTKVFIVLGTVLAIVLSCLTVAIAARTPNLRNSLDAYQQLYQAEFANRLSLETTMYTQLAMKDDQLRRVTETSAKQSADNRQLNEQLASLRTDLARANNQQAAAEAGRKKLEEMLGVQTVELTNVQ